MPASNNKSKETIMMAALEGVDPFIIDRTPAPIFAIRASTANPQRMKKIAT
jgi:hypothetical protein